MNAIDFDRDAVFVVGDDQLHVIGAAHLAYGDSHAELAVSVLHGCRDLGIGAALLRRAHMHDRNWRVPRLFTHCLRENCTIMRLARNGGMNITTESGEAEAWINLPRADTSSYLIEAIEQRVALGDYALKSQLVAARRVVEVFVAPSHG